MKSELELGAERTDADLVRAVLQALEWDVGTPHKKIKVRVADGWVTLEGEVNLQFQRTAPERAVSNLAGVKGVRNLITIKPSSRVEA